MASTTTLKLPEDLKARIAPLARLTSKTPHAWMLEALETQIRMSELRQAFIHDALVSASEIDKGGALYAMEDIHDYILARTAGKPVTRPQPVFRPDTQHTEINS